MATLVKTEVKDQGNNWGIALATWGTPVRVEDKGTVARWVKLG